MPSRVYLFAAVGEDDASSGMCRDSPVGMGAAEDLDLLSIEALRTRAETVTVLLEDILHCEGLLSICEPVCREVESQPGRPA